MDKVEIKRESIFDIISNYTDIMNIIESNGGELTEDIEQQLNNIQIRVDQKLRAYDYFINMNEAKVNYLKQEITNLNNKINATEKVISYLHKNILTTVDLVGTETKTGNKQIKTDYKTFNNINKIKFETISDTISNTKQSLIQCIYNGIIDTIEKDVIDYSEISINITCNSEDAIRINDILSMNDLPNTNYKLDVKIKNNDYFKYGSFITFKPSILDFNIPLLDVSFKYFK